MTGKYSNHHPSLSSVRDLRVYPKLQRNAFPFVFQNLKSVYEFYTKFCNRGSGGRGYGDGCCD